MTARRGKRIDGGLPLAPPPPPVTRVFAVGERPLPVGTDILPPGVEVPGAADWPRIEAWVSARRVRAASEGDYVPYEEWIAAHPGMCDQPAPNPEPAVEEVDVAKLGAVVPVPVPA